MTRRLLRLTGTVLLIAVALVIPTVVVTSAPASAEVVVDGCTIVSNPTPTNFTDCPDADFAGADLAGVDLSHANLAGASFVDCYVEGMENHCTAANLTDANLTGTLLVPPNQSVTATSQAGAVATWSTPSGIPGATPGSCTPPSGSTFPLFSSTVTCQVLDANNDVATGTFQVNVQPTTQYFTRVLLPSDGAVLAGAPYLDAAAGDSPGVTKVQFELTGGTLSQAVIATATPTIYGWLAKWNTTTVPNGTYSLQSVATDADNNTDTSTPITITVNNQLPVTAVLIPSNGAAVSGATALLDASASSAVGIASVTFEVSGGALSDQVIATATPTYYGWLAQWNTTAVPNGTYSLQSVATDTVAETTTSSPITVTVDNPAAPVSEGDLPAPIVGMASLPDGSGYWLVDAQGGVSAHGFAVDYGSMAGQTLNAPITHIVSTPDGKGYWLVAADGGTFTFGDAGFYGSMGGQHLNAPVVDIAPTQDGKGYWLVASDGGVFTFGDATFHGSMGGQRLNKPVVGISPDYATGGYWEVATDGGVFAFNAPFLGSTGNKVLNQPIIGMAASADAGGYWFVASDGGVFTFGDATFSGSGVGSGSSPIVGIAADPASGGYWLATKSGAVLSFEAPYYGAD
jgi:uncharacterized protein YjbI with pentapeptide repeats